MSPGTQTRPPARPGERSRPRPAPRPAPPRRPAPPAARRHRGVQHRRPAPLALGRRVRFLRLLLVMIMLAMAARLVQIQVLESSHYQAVAGQELTVTVPEHALRGPLLDRDGAPLAVSIPTEDIYADDYLVPHPVTEALALSPLLHVPATTLATELHRPSGYVLLAKRVSQATAARLMKLNFAGLSTVDDPVRETPDGTLAEPVLGTVNNAGKGAAGLEYQFNAITGGHDGSVTTLESPAGVPLPQTPVVQHTASVPGSGIELTLDQSVQYEAEQALAKAIVSSHALSGTDILAMANLVATSPGATQAACGGGADGGAVLPGVAEAPCNIADDQLYEPGSVFKLVTFSAALGDGLISPSSTFTVPYSISLDGSTFHDAEAHPTERLTATQILAQSSNIGTSEIAQVLGETRLLAQVKNLGFGSPTGLGFPGESDGLLATAAQWEPTDLVSLPIGQVDAVTAQQVLDAYNTVADGGVFVGPRLVRGTVGADGTLRPAPASTRRSVIPAATDATLTSMLEQVVAQGTGTSAVVPGYTVAGKTGTAQIPTPGKDSYEDAYMASFTGFAPANHPVLSAIVVLRRPTPIFGGTVAAPVFSQIMGYALHRYDIPTTPGAPTVAQPTTGSASQVNDIT